MWLDIFRTNIDETHLGQGEGRGAMVWGALPMSLPAVRFRISLGAVFSEKCYVSSLSILGHC